MANELGLTPPLSSELQACTLADRLANSRKHCCATTHTCKYAPYSETLPLQASENETVQLFRSRNYKLSASLGVNSHTLRPLTVVLDTGAGPNLVNKQ